MRFIMDNKKSNLGLWQLVGFAFASFLGTILHFLYDWTNSSFAALFSGVNESTWEHMKLLFFPMLLFAIIESFFIGKQYSAFWCTKLKGTLLGLVLIPVLFYTYNGIFGKSPDYVNIAVFFISAAIAYLWETKAFNKEGYDCKSSKGAILAFCAIAVLFWIFTFSPPEIPLFQDPISMLYGIQK